MNDLQQRLARAGLEALAPRGFVLAGGYALQAHNLVDRPSEDIDLFTNDWDPSGFSQAVAAASTAFEQAGCDVTVIRRAETFARLRVVDRVTGQEGSVDLAADARSTPPALLAIGPVLSEEEAVASKVAALFSRGEARDYLDVAAILDTGRYDQDRLQLLAARADPGFRVATFAEGPGGDRPVPRRGIRPVRRGTCGDVAAATDDARLESIRRGARSISSPA
jgi:hypothetical protein